jgi:hypothetical protein
MVAKLLSDIFEFFGSLCPKFIRPIAFLKGNGCHEATKE